MSASRRTFLGTILGGWAVTGLGAVGYPIIQYLEAPPLGEQQKQVTLSVDDLAVGQAVQIIHQGQPVIVMRKGEAEFATLSAVCTHLGCVVKWDETTSTLQCPCHAARFAADGTVLGGPPQTPLPLLPTRVEDGKIVIGGPA